MSRARECSGPASTFRADCRKSAPWSPAPAQPRDSPGYHRSKCWRTLLADAAQTPTHRSTTPARELLLSTWPDWLPSAPALLDQMLEAPQSLPWPTQQTTQHQSDARPRANARPGNAKNRRMPTLSQFEQPLAVRGTKALSVVRNWLGRGSCDSKLPNASARATCGASTPVPPFGMPSCRNLRVKSTIAAFGLRSRVCNATTKVGWPCNERRHGRAIVVSVQRGRRDSRRRG